MSLVLLGGGGHVVHEVCSLPLRVPYPPTYRVRAPPPPRACIFWLVSTLTRLPVCACVFGVLSASTVAACTMNGALEVARVRSHELRTVGYTRAHVL